jgi:hypothetical protein
MAQAKLVNGILGGYQKSNIDKVCVSTSVNMYFERQGNMASSPAILRSIQGTKLALDMPEKNCRGMFRASRGFNGYPMLYAVFGSHLYLIIQNGEESFNSIEIGRVSNGINEPVSMCETGGYGDAHPHLIVADGAQLFAVDTTVHPEYQIQDYKAVALPKRTDGSFIHPSHVYYLFGYLAVLDQGTDAFVLSCQYPWEEDIYGDDIFMLQDHEVPAEGSIPAYTIKGNPQGFKVYSEWSTDSTRAMIGAGSYLYTFGDRSFQAFSYNDDKNFPFQSPDTAAGAIGILAPRSIAAVGQKVFWLGSSDIGQFGVFEVQGSTPKRISTNDIEREIRYMKFPDDAVAQVWQENKHVFYAITFRKDNRTLVYDESEDMWSVRASYDPNMPEQEGHWRPQYATLSYDKLFFGTIDDSKLMYLAEGKWTEYDGLQIVRRRRSGAILSDFSPFYCNSVKLIINNGQVTEADELPQVSLRYTWDGTQWSDQELATVGMIGRYDWNTQWWTLGYGEILSLEFACSDPYDFTIIGAVIQVEQSGVL